MNKIPLIGRFNGMYDLSSELLSSSLSFHFVHTLINYGARLYMFAGLTADTSRFSNFSIALRFIIRLILSRLSRGTYRQFCFRGFRCRNL